MIERPIYLLIQKHSEIGSLMGLQILMLKCHLVKVMMRGLPKYFWKYSQKYFWKQRTK